MNFNLADLEKVPLNPDVVKSIINTDFLFVDGGNKHVEAVLYTEPSKSWFRYIYS